MGQQLVFGPRTELGLPVLLFGGVLVLSTAFCGAMDAVQDAIHGQTFEEVKVIRAENVIGSPDIDLMAGCKKDHAKHALDVRCRTDYEHASLN